MKTLGSLLILWWMLAVQGPAWEVLRQHPENSHIFEFRERPTLLRTFAEHYGAVIHAGFDHVPYLELMERDQMNLTRVFLLGFRHHDSNPSPDPLTPAAADFVQPWQRDASLGISLDGLGKWDFTRWNNDYFTRLDAFLDACGERDIVVELTLFCTFYLESEWQASPFHPANNVQEFGPDNRHDSLRPVHEELMQVQEDAVRRIVREVNKHDHIYFEIQNEPFWNQPGIKDDQEVAFHLRILEAIRDEESRLPNRHLVAHNFPQQAQALAKGFDVFNEHYPAPVPGAAIAGGEAALRDHYDSGMIVALDETQATNAQQTRLEAWMFLHGGGGVYNGLDYVHFLYSVDDEAGDTDLGNAHRQAVRGIGNYMDDLHLVALRRDFSWIAGGLSEGATVQAMASPGQQHVAYFHHGKKGAGAFPLVYDPIDSSDHSVALEVILDDGSWRATWTRPADLAVLHVESFNHPGGTRILEPVVYQEDVALRLDRTGEGDLTPPPIPAGLSGASKVDGSVEVTWSGVNGSDLSGYRIYRDGISLAGVPADGTDFVDSTAVVGTSYRYSVAAFDLNNNESAPGRHVVVVSELSSFPYHGNPLPVPGLVQAQDFDGGGQDVAYHDLTPENDGGEYRPDEAVDIAAEDGFHVTAFETGEWMNYTLQVGTGGEFIVELRLGNAGGESALDIEVDGTATGEAVLIESGPIGWQSVISRLQLDAGTRVLRLNAGAGEAVSVDWLKFQAAPKEAPTARAGPDREVEDDDGDGLVEVPLDGSGSEPGSDPIVSFKWLIDDEVVATGVLAEVMLPVGEHVLELLATDAAGREDRDAALVRVTARGFVNGSFESGLAAWIASGNQKIQSAAPYVASDGLQLISFNNANSMPDGVLSQTFATDPGQYYQLSFDIGVLAYNKLEQRLQVQLTGNAALATRSMSIFGSGGGAVDWRPESLVFQADGDATTLVFRDVSPATVSLDLLLDNVRIIPRIFRILTVESSPVSQVQIAVSTADENGLSAGATIFSRTYGDEVMVSLAAPATAGGLRFQRWLRDGVDPVTSREIDISMDRDHTLIAIYEQGPPVITSPPADVAAAPGAEVAFQVEASGGTEISYQWRFNGVEIPGAVSDILQLAGISEADAGSYDVVVSNAAGSVTSVPATLSILTASLVNGSFESGFEGWTAAGVVGLRSSSPYSPSDGSTLVAFNSQNRPPDGVLSQTFATVPGDIYRLSFSIGVLAYNKLEQRLRVDIDGESPLRSKIFSITGAGGGNVIWRGESMVFTADGTAATVTFTDVSPGTESLDLLLDHVLVAKEIKRTLVIGSSPEPGVAVSLGPPSGEGTVQGFTPMTVSYQDGTRVTLEVPEFASGGRFQRWLMDGELYDFGRTTEVEIRADHEFTAIYGESEPVILGQPADFAAGIGGSALFQVTAGGGGTLAYQWRLDGNDIPGAVEEIYEIEVVTEDDYGFYDVVVSNSAGSVTSEPAELSALSDGVVNGSFESGYNGWTAVGNQRVQLAPAGSIPDGVRYVAFNHGNKVPDGVLSQSFATVAGKSYRVGFQIGTLSYNTREQALQVEVIGNDFLASRTVFISGAGGGNIRWQVASIDFVADGPSAMLVFHDRSPVTDSIDLLLDDVSVAAIPSAASAVLKIAPAAAIPRAALVATPGGAFEIRAAASVPGWYELQRSEDLKIWKPVARKHMAEPGELDFTDPEAPKDKMFYRIALPPGTAGQPAKTAK